MPEPVQLDGASLTIDDVVRVARDARVRVLVDPARAHRLGASRRLVEAAIASGQTMYGINTGFGKLANVAIAPDQLDQLQANLIRSHAAGVGDPMPGDVVRGLMLLRANVLLRPTSGVRPALVDGAGRAAQRRPGTAGAGAGERGGERRPRSIEPRRAGTHGRRASCSLEEGAGG